MRLLDRKFFCSIICIQTLECIQRKDMKTKRKKLADRIIEYLVKNRDNGKKKITEEMIARYFKVSRTPVREVLKYLEQEGLIQTKRCKGITFKKFSEEEIKEIYDLRAVLEEVAVRQAVKNITKEDIKKLRSYVRMYNEARKRKDRIAGEEADRLFHGALIGISGNRYLSFLVNRIRLFSIVFKISIDRDRERYNRKVDINPYSHTKIIDAITTGNPDIAGEVIKNHILWARDYMIKILKKGGDEKKLEVRSNKKIYLP